MELFLVLLGIGLLLLVPLALAVGGFGLLVGGIVSIHKQLTGNKKEES
jgi:hypothetical protein